jgi:gluconate kinase
MPASLLESQCALLERPTEEERAITVDIRESPAALVKQLLAQCRDGLNATHVL